MAVKLQYFSTDQANAQRPRTPTIAQGQWPSREVNTGDRCWCYYMFGKVSRAENRAFWVFSPPKQFLTSFPRSCFLSFCGLSGSMPHTRTDSHVHKAVHKQMWKCTYMLIYCLGVTYMYPKFSAKSIGLCSLRGWFWKRVFCWQSVLSPYTRITKEKFKCHPSALNLSSLKVQHFSRGVLFCFT